MGRAPTKAELEVWVSHCQDRHRGMGNEIIPHPVNEGEVANPVHRDNIYRLLGGFRGV